MIEVQGGDPRVIDDPGVMGKAAKVTAHKAESAGFVAGIDTVEIGIASNVLGAGRETSDDEIDHSVGLVMKTQLGAEVAKGDALLEIHHREGDGSLEKCVARLCEAFEISDSTSEPPPLIHRRL
jgi:thymidine phosphorylase